MTTLEQLGRVGVTKISMCGSSSIEPHGEGVHELAILGLVVAELARGLNRLLVAHPWLCELSGLACGQVDQQDARPASANFASVPPIGATASSGRAAITTAA